MSTKIFTNRPDNTLYDKFNGIFTYVKHLHHFDVLVGYFRASGYFHVQKLLADIPKVRILVGIDVDRLTKEFHDRGQQFLTDGNLTKAEFLKSSAADIQQAEYDEATEAGILQFLEDLTSGKVEMRAHPEKRLHAKVYIFRPEPFNEHTPSEFITGSSNLTAPGLGLSANSNYEFNVSIRDHDLVVEATNEFEALWNEAVPILHAEAAKLKALTYLRDGGFTPHELFIKLLIEYFGNRIEYDPYNIETLLPSDFKRLKYQTDAANQGYNILLKHNGFLLADVVGLGKTVVACMVLKKFIYENGTLTKVLVVCPPAIKSSWQETAVRFQIDNHFTYITTGSLARVLDLDDHDFPAADQYDVVVVDESHKFRNDATTMYTDLRAICKTRRARPGIDGDDRKKVLLISATPLNNGPEDIENQLYLFQDARNSTLEGTKRNLQEYFRPIKEKYKKLASADKLDVVKLRALFMQLRTDIIEPLVIRRTRADIEKNEAYKADLDTQGIRFPKIGDPEPLYYRLDSELARLFFDSVRLITGRDENKQEVNGFKYYRYRAIEYLADRALAEERYGNVASISERLAHIMRVLLVKRLESSFEAFKGSLRRLHKAIGRMLKMLDDDRVFIAPDLDINDLLDRGWSYDQIEARIAEKGGNNQEFPASAFEADYPDLLRAEQAQVAALLERWERIQYDPKLDEFIRRLQSDLLVKKRNPSGQLVIFTESTETAADLAKRLGEHGYQGILCVSADNRQEVAKAIKANFDANVAPEKQATDYRFIITTEVLAEGVNLHRANVIVNYDVPWNATRLMQRIGRVNRIGSTAPQVYVYNFYPSAEGDQQLRLVNNALRKLQAFHTAFGEDNRIFSHLEEVGEAGLFGSQKAHEEVDETQLYLKKLRDFRAAHPKRFRAIQALPHKARTGRLTTAVEPTAVPTYDAGPAGALPYELASATVAYLKADNHAGTFCLVPAGAEQPGGADLVELSFLQAARLFEAPESEVPAPLPAHHHAQTRAGLAFFRSEYVQDQVQSPISHKSLSAAEKSALTNLRAALKTAPTEQKKTALRAYRDAVTAGTFASKGLPTEINAFFKQHGKRLGTNADDFYDALFTTVLDRYALSSATDGVMGQPPAPRQLVNPGIVLTVSFC